MHKPSSKTHNCNFYGWRKILKGDFCGVMALFPSLGFPSLDSSCSFKEIWKGARCATVSLRPRAAAGQPRCPCLNDPHPAAWLPPSSRSHLALSAPECNLENDFGDFFRAWRLSLNPLTDPALSQMFPSPLGDLMCPPWDIAQSS